MQTTLDAAGRIVVPKAIRESMGLKPGSRLDIAFTDGRIEIDFAPTEFRVEMRDGLPVLVTDDELPPISDDIVRDTLEEIRDERLRHIADV